MYSGHARLSVCLPVRGRMPTQLHGPGCNLGVVGMSPIYALLGGFAIGARIALLWQHNANAKCQRVHACTRSMPSYKCKYRIFNALLINHDVDHAPQQQSPHQRTR